MTSRSTYAIMSLIFLLLGGVLTGSVVYAEIKGLNITGITHTVNFDQMTGFSPNNIDINYGDSIYLNWALQEEVIYEPQPATIQYTFSFDGLPVGNTAVRDVVSFTPQTNQYGLEVNNLIHIEGIGAHRISIYIVWIGQEGQPYYQNFFDLDVTIYAPQVMKTLTLGVSGNGNVFCGPNPVTSEVQVYSGESNKVYTKDQHSIVYLRARPNIGAVFSHWLLDNGTQISVQDPVFELSRDMSALAVFSQQSILTVSTNGFGYVMVSPSTDTSHQQDQVPANTIKSLQHSVGTQITLYAYPLVNCQFLYWQLPDGTRPTSTQYHITLTDDSFIEAIFDVGTGTPTVQRTNAPTNTPTIPPTIPPTINPTPIPTSTPPPTEQPVPTTTPIPTETPTPTTPPINTPTTEPTVPSTNTPTPTPTQNPPYWIPNNYRWMVLLLGLCCLAIGSTFGWKAKKEMP